jgi:hypothetical protein
MERGDATGVPFATDALAKSEPAALADAGQIVERAPAAAGAPDEARARFRRDGAPMLPPDEQIAPFLEPGEQLVALRHAALLDRREPSPGARLTPGVAGDLYVTSRRLVLVGRVRLSFELGEIEDAVVSGERLLLVLRDGRGVALQVAQPRLLWVEIAAARALARPAQPSGRGPVPEPAAR